MGRRRRQAIVAIAVSSLAVSCTTEPVVTSVVLSNTSFTLDAIGATQQLTANVTDQNGRPMNVSLTWASDQPQVATVNGSGLVTAVGNGTARITATAGGASGSATATVAQQVSTLAKTGGDGQTGPVGVALPTAVEVRADDRLGNPVSGVNVVFAVSAGVGGSVASGSVTTSAAGRASTTWTLGRVAGAAQSVTANAQGRSVTFNATATAGPADSLVKVSGDNQSAPGGTALAESLVVRVADRFGNAVSGHTVNFSVTSGGGSVAPTSRATSTNGRASTRWTLGTSGSQQAQATASGVTVGSPATFTATALVGTVAVHEGNNQTGLVGFGVNVAPAVRVVNPSNQPLAGLTVTFAVTGGGGSVTGATQLTGTDGVARVGKWTLGSAAGGNMLTATVTGSGFSGNPVQFTATGVASTYAIELRTLTTLTTSQQQAFNNARDRWQQLVFADLPSQSVNIPADACGVTHPAVNETIDDLVIFVRVETIDGPGGTLASAGPCVLRPSGNLPALGVMRFDAADLSTIETNGQLGDVILHEMAHVLGFGTLWAPPYFNFLQNPSLPSSPGADTHFNGPKAITAFDGLGGTSYSGGQKVPVENTLGGAGTRDGHWRESVFDHELMTGFVEAAGTANPLSRLSVASLWDLGYTVNLDGSDAYTQVFTGPARVAGSIGQLLLNDIATGPIYVVDRTGRVTRVIRY